MTHRPLSGGLSIRTSTTNNSCTNTRNSLVSLNVRKPRVNSWNKPEWHKKRIPSAARMLIMAIIELLVAFSTGITRWHLTRSRTISTMVHSSLKLALHHTHSNWWTNLKRKTAELRMYFRKAMSGSWLSSYYCRKLCLYRFQLLSFSLGSGFIMKYSSSIISWPVILLGFLGLHTCCQPCSQVRYWATFGLFSLRLLKSFKESPLILKLAFYCSIILAGSSLHLLISLESFLMFLITQKSKLNSFWYHQWFLYCCRCSSILLTSSD